MLVPFTYMRYHPGGGEFPEYAGTELPFDPQRSIGLDVSGNLMHDTLSYDGQLNNGSQGNASGLVSGSGLDNRMGFYGRVQYAGAGTNADFTDSPDLAWHKHLVWAIGAAAGYESQNSSFDAFPSSQSTAELLGLSSGSAPGFYGPMAVNGNLYRATADGHVKYRGFSFNGAIYFQQYNDELPAGATTDTFRDIFGRGSLFQVGYFGEAGYFVVPHQWEVAGRFGELLTEGGDKQQFEYTLGVNYYIFGENAKVQAAVTYIPNAAAYTYGPTDTFINTQDIIGQLQFQVQF